MSTRIAITRGVSPNVARCELTHLARDPIDVAAATRQHLAYEARLAELGCDVHHLDAEPDYPDSVFVEDAAIVLDELAIVMRPGAASRRGEAASIARALEPYRPLRLVTDPGTIDGGDVLRVGRTLYVGASTRTNAAAVEQLRRFVDPHGYEVATIPVRGALHLKSGVTSVADRTLLINRTWIDPARFGGLQLIDVDPSEPAGANALQVGATVVCASAFPRTRERLDEHGIATVAVDATELAKAEGGLTCCSLIFETR